MGMDNNTVEFVILLAGGGHVFSTCPNSLRKAHADQLKAVMQTGAAFEAGHDQGVCCYVRGDKIVGFYVKEGTGPIESIAESLKKSVEGDGEAWKQS
jgi:hypothetical protein